VREHRKLFPVRLLCAAVAVSRSGFYRWMREPVGRRQLRREALLARIRLVHHRSRGVYGSPRVQRALALEGPAPCRNTVALVMKAHGLQGRTRRRRVRTTVPSPAVASDLLGRGFRAEARDRVWTSDITYLPTGQGYLYLAGVMDLFSRRIVGWSMATHLRQELVIDAVKMAIVRRCPPPGLILHSDRGCQYTCDAFRALLAKHQIRQSMSRQGNCYDNAPTESLWSTLKREVAQARTFATRAQARQAVFEYIEIFYNRRRLHSRLDYLSPEAFEARAGG
jgi:transposase InsO family protein